MTTKMQKQIIKIICCIILLILASFFPFPQKNYQSAVYIIAYFIVGYDVIKSSIRNIFHGKFLDENFLMTIATIGAFFIEEFPEAVSVMLFYQIGELFQNYAVDKSRKSVSDLMDIKPDYANVYRDEKTIKVSPEEVKIGEIIGIKPGEKIPLDGIVIEGSSHVNTVALTGESVPKKVIVGEEVLSGYVNNDGILKVKVTKPFEESTVSKILDLVENASSKKSKSEHFISKFARIYTPIVVFTAIFLSLIPPLILNNASFNEWFYRSLSFLVVSCPCALVISIPLSFFGGIGASSRVGVLVKGSNYLEALSKAEIIVCDKTGTLTEGKFEVQKIEPKEGTKEELLKYAALAENFSNHPISISLKKAYGKKINEKLITETKEIAGCGIFAKIEGKDILVGNEKLMQKYKINMIKNDEIGTIVYVAMNKKFMGSIVIADKIKPDSYKAIEEFKKNNIKKIVMLTGDKENISQNIANKLKIDTYYAELLPQNKVEIVEQLSREKSENGKLVFIGDGVNDAPVLALSDIGVAMGALGSDAAIEAADIVIMTDEPSKLAQAIQISHKTMNIVRQNIIFAITVKIGVLILSAFGFANMWAAVFADVGVSVLAILNALRILKK